MVTIDFRARYRTLTSSEALQLHRAARKNIPWFHQLHLHMVSIDFCNPSHQRGKAVMRTPLGSIDATDTPSGWYQPRALSPHGGERLHSAWVCFTLPSWSRIIIRASAHIWINMALEFPGHIPPFLLDHTFLPIQPPHVGVLSSPFANFRPFL